jgi:molybdenum cofactor biosynthesis enzyme MoaA
MRGRIHLNTNGSRPEMVSRLIDAGLNSIRVSLNSVREAIYTAYYQPRAYRFSDVAESIRRARQHGLWTSINYLSFPGVTDDENELAALSHLIESTGLQMIQWRNLNIDPDWYVNSINLPAVTKTLGMPSLLQKVREKFPHVRFGYFNPPVAGNQ